MYNPQRDNLKEMPSFCWRSSGKFFPKTFVTFYSDLMEIPRVDL